MYTGIVLFDVPEGVTADEVRRRFAEAAPEFRKPEGLMRKMFLLADDGRTAGGAYLWRSRQHAERFYAVLRPILRERWGEPRIQLFQTPILVDNETGQIVHAA